MTFTWKKIGGGAIGVSPTVTTLYTNPQNTKTGVKHIIINNTNASTDVDVKVWIVDAGGSPDNTNQIINTTLYAKDAPFSLPMWQVLEGNGDTIQAQAGSSGVSIRISGATE